MSIKILAAALFGLALLPASQEPIRISVSDPRPVAAAAAEVEKRLRKVVTYEDVRYVHPSDIVDVTEKYSRSPDRSKRLLVMKTGAIDLTYTPRPDSLDDQIGKLLGEILAVSKAAGNTGEFRVLRVDGGHHIVPVAFKGATGAREGIRPMLDRPITFARTEGSLMEVVSRIVAAVSAGEGGRLELGNFPTNLFFQRRVVAQAQNEPARDVVWRVLQSIRPDLSWKLSAT